MHRPGEKAQQLRAVILSDATFNVVRMYLYCANVQTMYESSVEFGLRRSLHGEQSRQDAAVQLQEASAMQQTLQQQVSQGSLPSQSCPSSSSSSSSVKILGCLHDSDPRYSNVGVPDCGTSTSQRCLCEGLILSVTVGNPAILKQSIAVQSKTHNQKLEA